VQDIETCEREITMLEESLKAEGKVKELKEAHQKFQDTTRSLLELEEIMDAVKTHEEHIERNEQTAAAEKELEELSDALSNSHFISRKLSSLAGMIDEIGGITKELLKLDHTTTEGQKELKRIRAQLEKRCPLCGRGTEDTAESE